jgi:hypothetical protein
MSPVGRSLVAGRLDSERRPVKTSVSMVIATFLADFVMEGWPVKK